MFPIGRQGGHGRDTIFNVYAGIARNPRVSILAGMKVIAIGTFEEFPLDLIRRLVFLRCSDRNDRDASYYFILQFH